MADDARAGGVAQDDGPPPGTETWIEETKGFERVIDVALALDEPRTAGWIAEETHVSEQTAREYLDLLADVLGVVTATTARGVTKYQPDPAWLRFQEVSALVEAHDQDELLERIEKRQERIQEVKTEFGVESPAALRSKAAAEETSLAELRECRKVASEWETLEHDLDVAREAIDRYEEYSRESASA